MRAQFSVQCSTSHAQEDAQVPAGPARVLRSAVGAFVVARYVAQQVLKHALIASLLAFRYCARHSVCVCSTRSLVVSCSGEARRGEAGATASVGGAARGEGCRGAATAAFQGGGLGGRDAMRCSRRQRMWTGGQQQQKKKNTTSGGVLSRVRVRVRGCGVHEIGRSVSVVHGGRSTSVSGLAQGGGHWDWPGGEQVSLPNHSQYM